MYAAAAAISNADAGETPLLPLEPAPPASPLPAPQEAPDEEPPFAAQGHFEQGTLLPVDEGESGMASRGWSDH